MNDPNNEHYIQLKRLKDEGILTDNAHILLFSCLVAGSDYGQELVKQIATLTGAYVHANSEYTGNQSSDADLWASYNSGDVGADWDLNIECSADGCDDKATYSMLGEPINDSVNIDPIDVDLIWKPVYDSDGVQAQYCLTLIEEESNAVIFDGCEIPSSVFRISLEYGKTYSWKIEAKDQNGNILEASEWWNFSTASPPFIETYDVMVQHYYPDNFFIAVGFYGEITSAEVISGSNIINTFPGHAILGTRPDIGDSYIIRLTFSDGTYQDVEYTVSNINDNHAWIIYPEDNGILEETVPEFSWQAAPGTVDHYHIGIHDITVGQDTPVWWSNIPSDQTSCVFNFDGQANTGLQNGHIYQVYLHSYDEYGNQATTTSTFTINDGPVQIPYADVLVDGKPSDWNSIQPITSSGIGCNSGICPVGADVKNLWLAQNGNLLYFMFETNNDLDSTGEVGYRLWFDNNQNGQLDNDSEDRQVSIYWSNGQYIVESQNMEGQPINANGVAVADGNYIEGFIDICELELSAQFGLSSGTHSQSSIDNFDRFETVDNLEFQDNVDEVCSTSGPCGAYIAPGVWQEFDCYNLAAIGKTTNDEPFTPSWRLIGGYWQWGRKGPDASQWYDTNTPNFAHGPIGPGLDEVNRYSISGWETSYAPDDDWSDAYKTTNDPCPAGYRVPTQSQLQGVIDNNTQSIVGTWSYDYTNYSSASFFGDYLMLPSAGFRSNISGSLYARGGEGTYYCSTSIGSYGYASHLYFGSGYAGMGAYTDRNRRSNGFSVRCIKDSNDSFSAPSEIDVSYDTNTQSNWITWGAMGLGYSYKLYWGTESGVTKSSEYGGQTSNTEFEHTGVIPGWAYYYRICAVDDETGVESELSEEVSVSVMESVCEDQVYAELSLSDGCSSRWWLNFNIYTENASRVYITGDYINGEYDLYSCGEENGCDHWWSTNNPECTVGGNNYFIGNEEPSLPFNITFHIVKYTGEEIIRTETIDSYATFICEPVIDPHVSSSSGTRGSSVLYQPGWGFTPNGSAELHFRRPDGSLSPTTTEQVDADGYYEHYWQIPSDAAVGVYQYWAVDIKSRQVTPEVDYEIFQ